jgi:outer membrane receptor protein involved in Fe transport
VFIDGVYRARNGVALSDLGEVQQIEVLRGPQGTLFGRNTSAGLVTITTVGPNVSEFEAGGEATYGDWNEARVSGFVNLPLVQDRVGLRVFAAGAQRDGFMDVTDFDGSEYDTNTRDMWTVRGQLLAALSDNADFRLIADYSKRDEECCAAMIFDGELLNGTDVVFPVANPGFPAEDAPGPTAPGAAGAISLQGGYGAGIGNLAANLANLGNGDIGNRHAFANRGYNQIVEDWGVSGELNLDMGSMTLTSVTAYRDWDFRAATDADYSAADLWYRPEGGDAGFAFHRRIQSDCRRQ